MTYEELQKMLNQNTRTRHWTDLLNEREMETFSFLTIGFWPYQICEEMTITPRELKDLKAAIQKKLGLKSEIELLKLVASHFDGPGSLDFQQPARPSVAGPPCKCRRQA
jgi:DNA-binding NarL/FixJ family response regulator